jgi:hypothetical protein
MSEVSERWNSFICDSRGCYLVNDPEITFQDHEEAEAYCDERNRALVGQMVLEERARIIGIIKGRMDLHNEFIDHCVKQDVRVSNSFFIALSELRCILRGIEQ